LASAIGNSQSDDIDRKGNDERQAYDGGADQYLAHGASVLSRSVNETAVLFVPDRTGEGSDCSHVNKARRYQMA
jgi:hypothetical protein